MPEIRLNKFSALLIYICALTVVDNGEAVKCYVCDYQSQNCPVLGNCPRNRDICTIDNFTPSQVQQADCAGGCETFLVTDPTGNIVQWKRGCVHNNQPQGTSSANICITEYNFGIRIDKCTCFGYLCNGTERIGLSLVVALICGFFKYLM